MQEKDYLYIGLGIGALVLILQNSKTIGNTVQAAGSVVNPLLNAAGKGAAIVTNPASYKLDSLSSNFIKFETAGLLDPEYTQGLLKAPFTGKQSWDLFRQQPNISTGINALFTNLGLFK